MTNRCVRCAAPLPTKNDIFKVAAVVWHKDQQQAVAARWVPGDYCKECAVEKHKRAWAGKV